MAVYHRTQRLQIYGEKPEVTKLFGDRYRMVVRCKAARDTEAWYNANKDQIFASFGTLYSAQMSVDGIDPRAGEAYPDMCLVSNSASYTQTGEYVITFVYETLTDTWTKEQDDEVTSTDNGLRVLERSEVAAIDTAAPYDEDSVGVATITDAGKTLYLASFQDQTGAESNAQVGRVVTRWAEAGILSRTEDFVGSQDSLVIEAIGPNPSTPSGFSLASKQESNYEGFQTNRFTFLKNNVILSVTEDKVGSQQSVINEVFNPTTYNFTGVDEDGETLSGYSEASRQASDFEGIKTVRYTFLKPSVLSVQQDFNNGLKRVSVQAFNLDSAAVSAALSEVTVDHKLIATNESDYEGIKTTTFQYQIDESFTEDYELNGLKRISLIELSATNFTAQDVGSVSTTAPTTGLYLGTQSIDNGGVIKVRQSTWLEVGVLSVSTNKDSITDEVVVDALNMDAAAVRSAVAAVTANHNLKSQSTNDFEGLQSFRYVFEIRSTTLETELGDTQIGVSFDTGIQTNGSSDFIIQRQYSISSANVASSIKKLIPPEINDPVFDGTGGTQKAYIVDQEVKPNGKDGAVLTRTFAMLPTHLDEWDEMVIRFPGVDRGPFQLDEGFAFRSQPYSEAVPVRICRDFFLSNPQRICRPDEFRPVDKNGNRVNVLTEDTVPTADEYIGYVNSGKYLNDRVSIHRWQGDIWERRITQFKAE